MTSTMGRRRRRVLSMSRNAAPVAEVTIPIFFGSIGMDACARGKQSLRFEHGLEPHELLIQRAFAHRADLVGVELVLSADLVDADPAVDFHFHAVLQRHPQPRRDVFHITHLSAADSNLSV
jgi:hypothetical protein